MITEYILAAAEAGSLEKFQKTVNEKIADGYEPFGSAVVVAINPASTRILQPMVKREVTPEEMHHHMVSQVLER
jgi:hypothetical protein